MGYDDHVYLAKLAEQAERYEGETVFSAPVRLNTSANLLIQRWLRT